MQLGERVARELVALEDGAPAADVADAVGRALGADAADVAPAPHTDARSCSITIATDPPAFAVLRFGRRSAIPSAVDQQLAAAAVERWRQDHQRAVVEAELAAAVERERALQELAEATAVRTDAERRTREWLERGLLPDALRPVPGLRLSSRYLPAASTTELAGGDFYDAVRSPDGRGTTLIIGDVQGKGVEAATLTALARHSLRAAALRDEPPAALLTELNRALIYGHAEQAAGGRGAPRFVTAAVARLRPTAGEAFEVVLARAGHPPPLVVRSAGDIELHEPAGMLLGVSDEPTFDEVEVTLGVGDTLLLYTDGVTEHRQPVAAFDERQLGLLVRNRRDTARAESIAQLVLDTVLLLAPEAARDDIALLVGTVTGRATP